MHARSVANVLSFAPPVRSKYSAEPENTAISASDDVPGSPISAEMTVARSGSPYGKSSEIGSILGISIAGSRSFALRRLSLERAPPLPGDREPRPRRFGLPALPRQLPEPARPAGGSPLPLSMRFAAARGRRYRDTRRAQGAGREELPTVMLPIAQS